mmetsp:Transcript_41150/g.55906  ORF Transcript_41150/g.55906 Transcript_41150/m.55906 type:complete len:246 (+) Transcript_41150:1174-1911(+)
MIERTKHRATAAKSLNGSRPAITKHQIFRAENSLASKMEDSIKNQRWGFFCLHYSVSEAAKYISIKILNKTQKPGKIGVRTVNGDAIAGEDYEAIDQIVEFNNNEPSKEVAVNIFDDDDWEPDEDFYLELYDPDTKQKLEGGDAKTTVRIIDDDNPGTLSFEAGDLYQHTATEDKCIIKVIRSNGCSGKIQCQYKTTEINRSNDTATPGKHYEHVEGILVFDHNVSEKEIEIPILQELSPEQMNN